MSKGGRSMSRLNYTPPDEYHGERWKDTWKKVDYYLNSNIRIWHNIQNEGYALHQHNAIEILVPIEKQLHRSRQQPYLSAGAGQHPLYPRAHPSRDYEAGLGRAFHLYV